MSNAFHRRPFRAPARTGRIRRLAAGAAILSWLLWIGTAGAEPHKWRVTDPAVARALVAQGARLIADYDSFQVIESDDPKLLEAGSDTLEAADQFDFIELNGRQLNTRATPAGIQPSRASIAAPAGKGLHLVHFAGPIKPEWRQALETSGARIISYLPHNAYLVYGEAPALVSLQSWARTEAAVQWDGGYLPEYKIHPRARAVDAKGNPREIGTTTFAIQLVADASVNVDTLRLIGQLKQGEIFKEFDVLHYHNVVVDLPADRLDELAAMPDVISIQPYFTPKKRDERQDQIVAGALTAGQPNGPGYLAWLASKGFTQAQFDASGFAVDVSDSGVDNGTKAPGHFALYPTGNVARVSRVVYNRLEGTPHRGSSLAGCDGHGTINAHIIGGYAAFTNGFPHTDSAGYSYDLGVCPFVRVGSSVIFDPDNFTHPDYVALQSRAWSNAARISNNSWGSDGTGVYDIEAQTYDALVRDAGASSSNRQMVIVFSAGNSGPGSGALVQGIGAPGTAKNVITVGSSDNVRSLSIANGGKDAAGKDGCDTYDSNAASAENVSDFSSRGPCDDGRMKPDLVAPGTHITGGVAQAGAPTLLGKGRAIPCFDASGVCGLTGLGLAGSIYNYFPVGQQFYTVSTGTSHSAPAVSGACALLRQYFINQSNPPPSPAMTKACLLNSARYLTGIDANDNLWSPNQGMGELNLGMAFDGVPCIVLDQRPEDKFTVTGQTRTFSGTIADPSKPFRVTLAWTDAPGSPVAAQALVNNLNLTVNAGGQTYKGNVFSGPQSITGGAADSLNNVESVFLPAGISGTFSVTVSAANIAGDAFNTGTETPQQDFALIIRNAEPTPAPVIKLNGYAITAESCDPANGAVDADETVTVEISLQNVGTAPTTDLVATLLTTNGVLSPGGPQDYGILDAGSGPTTRAFTFTAAGGCGQKIIPTFQLTDNGAGAGAVLMGVQLGTLAPVFRENFDTVLAPALPSGWTATKVNFVQTLWTTARSAADSGPNAAFIGEQTPYGVDDLISPIMTLPTGAAQLTFRTRFNLERGLDSEGAFDGGVLEIKIGSGPFTDIVAAGGSFVSGGYNCRISTGTTSKPSKNPLAGRAAWSGSSRGFITTTVNLPAAAQGQPVQFNWRCGFDVGNSYAVTGWWIDSVAVRSYWCCPDSAPPAPYVPEAATYNGLFFQPDAVRYLASGAITATTTIRGHYTGILQLGVGRFAFSGQFDGFGLATNVIPRRGTNALKLVLQVDATDNHRILGTVDGSNWLAQLDAERSVFNAITNRAPFAGTYTMSFPGSGDPADSTRPLGDGYGTVWLSTGGQVKLVGLLADGTPLVAVAPVSKYRQWPLYAAIAGGQMLGWLTFTNTAQTDMDGRFDWIKPPNLRATVYKSGISWATNVIGSALHPTAVPLMNFANGSVVLTGGNIPVTFTNQVTLNSARVVNLSSNVLKLAVVPAYGLFKGVVIRPDAPKAVALQGILLQKQNYGAGFFLGTNESGRVTFGP